MKRILILNPGDRKIKNAVRDFMYGCWCKGRRIGGMQMPPLNHLYITTTLKESGIDTEFVDAAIDYDSFERVIQNLDDFAGVIILSSTNSFKNDIKTLKKLKSHNQELLTILFGSHPTFMPEYCIKEDVVDILIFREPEFIIRDVVKKIVTNQDWRGVKGIGFRDNGKLRINEAYPFINLDELPIPDRSLLPKGIDYFNPVVKKMPYATMQTSRGCPAQCNFCTVPTFFGRKARFRSVENVMKEIRHIKTLGYREIFFRDETFTAYKKRNIKICESIIDEKIDLSWIANGRVDMIDLEQLTIMKQAGCHLVKFGVESGSQVILNKLHKGITIEQTQEAFRMCKEMGVDTHAHIMIGSPGETKETLEQTIKFIVKLNPSTGSFGICTPYPGTELFDNVASCHPDIKDGSDADMSKLHIQGFFN
ncbi:B12-binding domain-containing radical SAM protein, partial [Thermodesulfobacteriota bacterium]